MTGKRWFSEDDIALAKTALSALPGLSRQRQSLPDFLDAISDDIQSLVKTRGYTVTDIKATLASAGYDIGAKAIRTMLQKKENKLPGKRKAAPGNSASQ